MALTDSKVLSSIVVFDELSLDNDNMENDYQNGIKKCQSTENIKVHHANDDEITAIFLTLQVLWT